MNKPSNFFDAMDKVFEFQNHCIDLQKQQLINEIKWLGYNYNNKETLCYYFTNNANFVSRYAKLSYIMQFLDYSDEKIHYMIDIQANKLYRQLLCIQNSKINNVPFKALAKILKEVNL